MDTMRDSSGSIPPIVGQAPPPPTGRPPAESRSERSGLGIFSIAIGVILALGAMVGILAFRDVDPQSLKVRLFWPSVLFGLGAGAGVAFAGVTDKRTGKAFPWIGLVLNLVVFLGLLGLVVKSKPYVPTPQVREAQPRPPQP
jgi:peptidoglycan/LPS O-acetylase OafA/YrhL